MDAEQGPRPPVGAITIEREEADRWVLCLRGDVDTAVATRFANSHRRQRVVVDAIDAGGVTFISSSGLALMLLCAEASIAAGRHPVLRAASRPVNRALELSGIDNVFPRPEPAEMQSPLVGSGEDAASARGEPQTSGDRPQRGSDGSAEPG